MTPIDGISIVTSGIGGVIAFVLVVSIVGKLRKFDSFVIVTLGGLGLRSKIARPAAMLVVVIELGVALGLASGVLSLATAIAGLLLFLTLASIGLYAAIAHLSVPCGCFGGSREKLGVQTAVRSCLLGVLLAMYGLADLAGHQASAGATQGFVVSLVIAKWLFDWEQVSRPLAWRQ